MVDSDNILTCWYTNIPYLWIHNKDLYSCQRLYFIHENCIVHHYNKEIKLYEVFSKNYNLDNVFIYKIEKNINFPHNFFKIMNPYRLSNQGEYRVNGKKIDIPKDENLYLYLWKNFGFKKIDHIEVKDIDDKTTRYSKLNKELSPNFFDLNPINSKTDMFNDYKIKFNTSNIKRKIFCPERLHKDFVFYLNDNFPEIPYSNKIRPDCKTYHIGQLKLLISEIFFLTEKLEKIDDYGICIYIGSAGGFHIPILANMFPNILFMLYDGAKHYINPTHNIIIHQELFLEHNVEMFKEMGVYFISDIRVPHHEDYQFEKNVHKDNLLNRYIVMNLNPKYSLLKFRYPYDIDNNDEITHLNGEILFQTFAPLKSSETRLIPYNNKDLVEGDNIKYEDQLMYFNTQYRDRTFEDFDKVFGFNYDFYSFYKVMERFLIRCETPQNEIRDKIIIFLKSMEKIKPVGRPKSLQHKSILEILYGYSPKIIKK